MSAIRKLALEFVVFVNIIGCAPTKPTPQAMPTPMPQATQSTLPQQVQIIQPEKRSISVIGEGEVKVKPDMVVFSVGIEAEFKNAADTKAALNDLTQKAINILKEYGIEDKDIEISFYPYYNNFSFSSYSNKYRAYHLIKVTDRDPARFEDLSFALLESGAYAINQVEFRSSNMEQYQEQARTLALESAKNKAIAMAKTLGQEIGLPLSIQELVKTRNSYYSTYQVGMFLASSETVVDSSVPTDYSQLTVTATVTVEFELK